MVVNPHSVDAGIHDTCSSFFIFGRETDFSSDKIEVNSESESALPAMYGCRRMRFRNPELKSLNRPGR
jgi:hypothetical protein